jgi:hypothetical protein
VDWESSEINGSFLSSIRTTAGGNEYANMEFSGDGGFSFNTTTLANPVYYKAKYSGYSSSGVVAIYPTEVLNGNTFNSVYHCRVESQMLDGDSVIIDGHLVENIGLVEFKKRVDQVDTTWTLVRWHVIQY